MSLKTVVIEILHLICVVAIIQLAVDARAQPLSQLRTLNELRFYGSCDASGAVAQSDRTFTVADDEDNVLRVYHGDEGGAPLAQYDLSYANALKPTSPVFGRPAPAPLVEMDIEAATQLGDTAFWITSHGRNKHGEYAPDRLRFFATRIDADQRYVHFPAPAVTDLVAKLAEIEQLQQFDLLTAAQRAPKAPGGLSIEGMTATPDGKLMLGFRSPTPRGRSLVIVLSNPYAVLDGQRPQIEPSILLDLNGRGIRGITYWQGQYLIAAGGTGEDYDPALFSWSGGSGQPQEIAVDLPSDFNLEAFFTPDQRQEILLLSDDGNQTIDNKTCKKLKDPNHKFFRGVWVEPAPNLAQRR